MRVCRCHDALSKLVRKRDNSFVDGAQIVFGLHTLAVQVKFFFKHKSVVDDRLDFQIVIAGSDAFLLFRTCLLGNMPGMRSLVVRNAFDHRKKNFSCAARRTDNQTFAVCFDERPRKSRFFVKIVQMRIRNQLVDVLKPFL